MRRSTIKCICTFAIVCLIVLPLRGQNQRVDTNSLKPGAWALQFGIGSNFTLTSIQGASIAAKYHLSESNAVRAGITLGGDLGDGTSFNVQGQADTAFFLSSGNGSSHAATAALVVQYLWYANPNGVVHFYVALGPSFSYGYSSGDNESIGSYISDHTSRVEFSTSSTQWGIGATGAAGLEWFPAAWFSLRAEYANGIQYQWESAENSRRTSVSTPGISGTFEKNSSSNKHWRFDNLGVSFGLNVYF
jgi:hypothetical protein